MSERSQKAAIVTGSSRGIGKAIAIRLAKDGFAVTVNYAGNEAAANDVVKEITSADGRAIAVKADVSNAGDVKRLFDETEKAFGRIDAVVNNAGVLLPLKPIADTDDDTFDRTFAINVRGVFIALREAARRLPKGGRVVNFSTSAIPLAIPGYATYCASKAAVETMTMIYAKELRGREISVNSVAPGPTATDLFFDGKTPEVIDRLAKLSPFERLGTPEDIAGVVSFLLGPDGAWINGQTIRANGGTA